MGKSLAELNVRIGAKVTGFDKSIKKIERKMYKLQRNVSRFGDSVTRSIGLPFIGAIGASLSLFDKQAQAIAQVEAGLRSTGNAAGFSSEQLQKMASNLQKSTVFGDEDILKDVTAQLLTFTNITGEQFARTQEIVLDLATRMGGDLKGASIQLGKALNDPVANLSALGRAGIQFSKEQKNVINSLVETGRQAEAQNIILKELQKQFGDSAEAAAKAGLGPIKQLKNSLFDMAEDIGRLVLPFVNKLAEKIKAIAERFDGWSDSTKLTIVKIGALVTGIGLAASIGGRLIGTALTMVRTFRLVAVAIGNSKIAMAAFNLVMNANPIALVVSGVALLIGALTLAYKKSEKFRAVIAGLSNVAKEVFNIIKETIGGFVQSFKSFASGDFKKGISEFGTALANTNPITLAITQGARLGSAFTTGYRDSLASEVSDATEDAIRAVNIQGGLPPVNVPVNPIVSGTSSGAAPEPMTRRKATRSLDFQSSSAAIGTFSTDFGIFTEDLQDRFSSVVDRVSEKSSELVANISNSMVAMKKATADLVSASLDGFASIIQGMRGIANKSRALALIEIVVNTASGIAKAVAAGAGLTFPANIPAIASGVAAVLSGIGQAKAALSKTPALAAGGLAFGPTMAMVGDNFGARSNPEVIAPLNKLRDYIQPAHGGNVNITGRLVGNGRDLIAVVDYAKSEQNRYR